MTGAPAHPSTELVPLADLTPAPWNPRVIRDARFQNLCRSLQTDPDFLWLRPVLATTAGTIFAGNKRYQAAVQVGWKHVPTIRVDIPEQLAKERALRDNGDWGEYDDQPLGELLLELRNAGSALDVLGFEDIDAVLKRTLGEAAASPEGAVRGPRAASGERREQAVAEKFMIVIENLNEEQQAELLERLAGEGYSVRGLIA